MANSDEPISNAASAMGKKGGRARADSLSPKRRKEIAKKGAEARWGKAEKKTGKKKDRLGEK